MYEAEVKVKTITPMFMAGEKSFIYFYEQKEKNRDF